MNKLWTEYASIVSTKSQIRQFATQKHVYKVLETVLYVGHMYKPFWTKKI